MLTTVDGSEIRHPPVEGKVASPIIYDGVLYENIQKGGWPWDFFQPSNRKRLSVRLYNL